MSLTFKKFLHDISDFSHFVDLSDFWEISTWYLWLWRGISQKWEFQVNFWEFWEISFGLTFGRGGGAAALKSFYVYFSKVSYIVISCWHLWLLRNSLYTFGRGERVADLKLFYVYFSKVSFIVISCWHLWLLRNSLYTRRWLRAKGAHVDVWLFHVSFSKVRCVVISCWYLWLLRNPLYTRRGSRTKCAHPCHERRADTNCCKTHLVWFSKGTKKKNSHLSRKRSLYHLLPNSSCWI